MSGALAREEAPHSLGPVSAALVAELREEARKYGVLVWLDKDGAYTELVDMLIRSRANPPATGDSSGAESSSRRGHDFPFPLLAYRGSFLELMLALDGHEDGATMQPLVLHMPGFNEEDVAQAPVYELYRSGRRHRIALTTIVKSAAQGKVAPAEIEAALQAGLPSLEAADAWLDALLRGEASGIQVELPVLSAQQLFDDLVSGGPVAQRLVEPAMEQAIWRYLERTLGLDEAWRSSVELGPSAGPRETIPQQMINWALCVEFAHDLRREPRDAILIPLKKLPSGVVQASCNLTAHLRKTHPETYARAADEFEDRLEIELQEAKAEDLGDIDTFRFEDQKVFEAALVALREKRWERAESYAAERTEQRSFWMRRDQGRRTGWHLLRLAADLGLACAKHEHLLQGARGLGAAAERYAAGGYEVDAAQRRLEQAGSRLHLIQSGEFPALRNCLKGLRQVYRRWADAQALAFNAICKQDGFLPEPPLQQRTLFDDVVRPAVEAGDTVAYFVVDALRFEMAQQLVEWLGKESGTKLDLRPRYAELPSLTEVGMNVLAPVSREGRLHPEFDDNVILGFRAGEARVATPKARQKAMHERVGGETCPWISLEDLLDREVTSLRQAISRARLVVVHAEGLDKAGEKGVGLTHFEDELQRLRAAWFRLRDAGVQRFVMTADHGFLLQDEMTRVPVERGRKTDVKRRHVITRVAADHKGEVRVSSTELRYDGEEVQFIFPESSMPFDVGAKTKDFLHGGNSLQERLIPVLTAVYRHAKGGGALQYRVEAQAQAAIMGLHRIKGSVSQAAQQDLGFGGKREIELRLEALDGADVNIELVQSVGARIEVGAMVVPVDGEFELLFRLTGAQGLRTRVELRGALGGNEVIPLVLERRFAVDVTGDVATAMSDDSAGTDTDWLQDLPEGGVRMVFEHIHRFGAINEADATGMVGSPRKFRRFSQDFERYAERAPFEVRIDVSSGQKRYVREGG